MFVLHVLKMLKINNETRRDTTHTTKTHKEICYREEEVSTIKVDEVVVVVVVLE